jgi:hypothetical protein
MEKIDKHNYEAFFLDYMEGNLSAAQIEALFVFLEEYPELKSELELDFDGVVLSPSADAVENKDSLKVLEEGYSMNTSDDLMIASIEGNISPLEQIELDKILETEDAQFDYNVYQHTILNPDLSEKFENKKSLKRREGRVIPFYVRYAAAAAAVIILIALFYNPNAVVETNGIIKNGAVISEASEYIHPMEIEPDYKGDGIADEIPRTNWIQEKDNFNSNELVEMVVQEKDSVIDTAGIKIIPPIEDDPIVEQPKKDVIPEELENLNPDVYPLEDIGDVALADNIVHEEKLQFFTKAAGNVMDTDVSLTRDKNTDINEYVGFQFKIGKFEFERKKAH